MRDLRGDAQAIFRAGVQAVLGDRLIRESVRVDSGGIWLGEVFVERRQVQRIVVVGAGKASGAMAVGLVQALSPSASASTVTGGTVPSDFVGADAEFGDADDREPIELVGHVNVPEGCDGVPEGMSWPEGLKLFAARPIGVNEPTVEAIAGTNRMIELVRSAGPHDLIVVLISGGGSALLCQPIAGVTLEQKLAVIRHLSGAGANIQQLNTVRKHLSDVKGGGLARAASCHSTTVAPRMVTLVLSDVLGDPLDLIASGPTVSDTSTAADALNVLAEWDPKKILPEAVYRVLSQATPAAGDSITYPTIIVGNNAVAVDGAGIVAESLGYNHVMHSARQSEGDAESVGEHLAEMAITMLRRDRALHRQDALITGGEPVVRLAESSVRGKGGRNQQLVLAAYRHLLRSGLSDDEWQRIVLLSGGTDGEDGPTDAAGALIDASVHACAVAQELQPDGFLVRNDAYAFFERTGGLVMTGPTGTNVCDLRVALVDSIGS
jgi:glycerate-2-kinase